MGLFGLLVRCDRKLFFFLFSAKDLKNKVEVESGY